MSIKLPNAITRRSLRHRLRRRVGYESANESKADHCARAWRMGRCLELEFLL